MNVLRRQHSYSRAQYAGINWVPDELRDSSGARNRKTNLVGHCAVFVRNSRCHDTENEPSQ